MTRYWIAHARGCNFEQLRKRGFTTFYPAMDDYVFLEEKEVHRRYLTKQTELGVAFLKAKRQLVTISQEEMDRMASTTVEKIHVSDRVLVVQGHGSNLAGVVLQEDGTKILVRLEGYRRTYEEWVDKMDVVPEGEQLET